MVNKFENSVVSFDDDYITGGVNYDINVNPSSELQFGTLAKAKITLNMLDINYNKNIVEGAELNYYHNDVLSGKYIIDKVTRVNDTKYQIDMYDFAKKFDDISDTFINAIEFPITVGNLIASICEELDITYVLETSTNINVEIYKNVLFKNTKYSEILSSLLEIICAFGYFDNNGSLIIKGYTLATGTITIDDYKTQTISENISSEITKVQIKSSDDDIGVIVGSGTNTYTIESNPFLKGLEISVLESVAQNVLEIVNGIQYYTASVTSYTNFNVGEIVNITTRRGTFTILTMHITRSSSGLTQTISSVGNTERKQVKALNKVITTLNNKTNEIIATVDEFSVTLTEVETNLEDNILQTETNASNINQLPNEILLTVSESYTNNEQLISMQETIISQTSENIEFTKNTLQESIGNIGDGLSDVNERQSIIEETIVIDGSTITLGRSDSDIQVRIDNDSLDVIVDGETRSFFGSSEVQMGDFKWQPRSNGNLSLIYVGGN